MEHPLHEKLRRNEGQAITLGSFIDFISEQGWELCEYDNHARRYFPVRKRPEEIIGMFLEIDPKELEREKQAMLNEIRQKGIKS